MNQTSKEFKQHQAHYKTGIILVLMVGVLSSAGWVFTKIALREINPAAFIGWRFLLAALVLLPFSWKGLKSFNKQHWIRSCIAGFFMAIALSVWVEGMNQISNIGEAAFIVSLIVFFVPLISFLLGDKLSIFLLLSLIPALLGLYLLTGANGFNFEPPQLVVLLASFLFSIHIVFSARYTKDIPSLSLTTLQLFMVAVVALWVSAMRGTLTKIYVDDISTLVWIMFFCSAIIATSLRFGLQTKALTLVPAEEASMLSSLTPVFTAFLGWLILKENMTNTQLIGCALIFVAQPIYRWGAIQSHFKLR